MVQSGAAAVRRERGHQRLLLRMPVWVGWLPLRSFSGGRLKQEQCGLQTDAIERVCSDDTCFKTYPLSWFALVSQEFVPPLWAQAEMPTVLTEPRAEMATALDTRADALEREVAGTDQRLRRLYRLGQDGVVALEGALKERRSNLKAGQDAASAALAQLRTGPSDPVHRKFDFRCTVGARFQLFVARSRDTNPARGIPPSSGSTTGRTFGCLV